MVGVALVDVLRLLVCVEVTALFWFLCAALARGGIRVSFWIVAGTGGYCYACTGFSIIKDVSVLFYTLVERNAEQVFPVLLEQEHRFAITLLAY